jgi:hypothetical protein
MFIANITDGFILRPDVMHAQYASVHMRCHTHALTGRWVSANATSHGMTEFNPAYEGQQRCSSSPVWYSYSGVIGRIPGDSGQPHTDEFQGHPSSWSKNARPTLMEGARSSGQWRLRQEALRKEQLKDSSVRPKPWGSLDVHKIKVSAPARWSAMHKDDYRRHTDVSSEKKWQYACRLLGKFFWLPSYQFHSTLPWASLTFMYN